LLKSRSLKDNAKEAKFVEYRFFVKKKKATKILLLESELADVWKKFHVEKAT